MKKLIALTLVTAVAGVSSATAQPAVDDSNYRIIPYYTYDDGFWSEDPDSELFIGGYTWGADGKLYFAPNVNTDYEDFGGWGFYMTFTMPLGIFSFDGTNAIELLEGNYNQYGCVNMHAISNNVYFNSDGSQSAIHKYNIATRGFTKRDVNVYSFIPYGDSLIIQGVEGMSNTIFYSEGAEGDSQKLGTTPDASGAMATAATGFYIAPGTGTKIYRWSLEEMDEAIADGTLLEDATNRVWFDFASEFPGLQGSTSMLIHEGRMYLTITNWVGASILVAFDIAENGSYVAGSATKILSTDGRIGELATHNGEVFIGDANTIYSLHDIRNLTISIKKDGEKFILSVPAIADAQFQWYKNENGVFVLMTGETAATLTLNAFNGSDDYYCEVTIASVPRNSKTVTVTGTTVNKVNVYVTKISARTSDIKRMNVRVNEATGVKTRQVHFRAPINRAFTVVMAYGAYGDGDPTGYGYMWSGSRERQVFVFTEEPLFQGSVIGNRGLNYPVAYSFCNDEHELAFTGLATLRNDLLDSISGTVTGTGFDPLPLIGNLTAQQGDYIGHTFVQGTSEAGSPHYPEENDEDAHFFGTFTTRYNKAWSNAASAASNNLEEMAAHVFNVRVPRTKK